ncbi:amidinotransferase [Pseudonocardia sp. ICBG1122]|nr:amidinotransferase [Pseudonocardia pini]
MNTDLLISDTRHFRIDYVINPYMDVSVQPDVERSRIEHERIVRAHRAAGRTVRWMVSVPECPDMVYTANGAFVADGRAVLGVPPAARAAEIPYFASQLKADGYEIVESPYDFSGQGDALACGRFLLAGYGRRTDPRTHEVLAETFAYDIVPLHTADPLWYDLDLAVGVLDGTTVAYCPDALDPPAVGRLRSLGLDLIPVDPGEARRFALNLVSDGTTVTMTQGAPRLAATLRERGFDVVELSTTELRKGGGGVRCTALTLDNTCPAR